eukprot:970090_1
MASDIVLLTVITFYVFMTTTSQFVHLSPSNVYSNHTFVLLSSFGESLGCNIESWYSAYDQNNIFMMSYFEAIPGRETPILKSDILSFSKAYNYSYHVQTTFNISDTLYTHPDVVLSPVLSEVHLMDVVLSPSFIMVLSQVDAEYLFYRIISNFQDNIQDIRVSPMQIWKIPRSNSFDGQLSAATLFASDVFIIVYESRNSLLGFLVNANTAEPLSLSPNVLVSSLASGYSHGEFSDNTVLVNAIKVRASKTNGRYLIVWSAWYTTCLIESVQASLHSNDGSVVNSITIISQPHITGNSEYTLYDAIAFNISTQTGFYAILYYDTSVPPDNRLCVRIVDDSASNAFAKIHTIRRYSLQHINSNGILCHSVL